MEESKETQDLTAEEVSTGEAAGQPDGMGTTAGDAAAGGAPEELQQETTAQADAEPEEATSPEQETVAETGQSGATAAQASQPGEVTEVAPGQILAGVIRRVEDELVVVDVGYKADGVVPRSELTLGPGQSPQDLFEEGQSIYVSVLSIDPRDDALLLSERRARAQRAWSELEAALHDQRIIKAPVIEAVKGGLVVDVGARAFMPASHVERGFVSDLNQYVGKTVRARVIELDRSKNRIILSQKVVLEEEYQRQREATWQSLEEGQIREGIVKGITDFGVFVDLGGVDGLLHVSELAWNRVEHPADVVSEGQTIKVKVMKVDRERERISLSLKQTLPDPWDAVAERYPVGSIVEGQVVRLSPFGAFVRLEPGVEGLVHISQLADYHVKTPDEVVNEGQTVKVKVLRVQPEERRVSLSIKEAAREEKAAAGAESADAPAAPSAQTADESRPVSGKDNNDQRQAQASERESQPSRSRQEPVEFPEPSREGITLGEMFGDLFEETKERLARLARESEEKKQADSED